MGETKRQDQTEAETRQGGKVHAWLEFFRITNAPSVPGDAIAGAALGYLLFPGVSVSWPTIVGAGLAALGFYLAGLADNDIVDAEEDAVNSPQRPIPSGRISLGAARLARFIAFIIAFAIGIASKLPAAWFIAAAALSIIILAYNRVKGRFPRIGVLAMGLCRGGSVLAGMLAIAAPVRAIVVPSCIMVAGWTAYVAALTILAADEHKAHDPLPAARFLPGLTALIPALVVFLPGLCSMRATALILCGCAATFISWCLAVAPLGQEHDPGKRRQAVGMTIGALLYLQAGFSLAAACTPFDLTIAACFVGRLIARHATPTITGS